MRSLRLMVLFVVSGVTLALGIATLAWALAPDSSHAQNGAMHNCPQPGKWAIATWGGPDGTDAIEALATCGEGAVLAAYHLDPETQAWSRCLPGQPEMTTMSPLDNMQGVLALGGAAAPTIPTPTPVPTEQPSPTPVPWAGKEYTGHGDFGLDIELTVCEDGTCLSRVRLDWDACGWEETWIVRDIALEGDTFVAFEAEEMPQMRFVLGRFTSDGAVEGYAIYAEEVWTGLACTNGLMEWEAQ
jgi:hypothetical protein